MPSVLSFTIYLFAYGAPVSHKLTTRYASDGPITQVTDTMKMPQHLDASSYKYKLKLAWRDQPGETVFGYHILKDLTVDSTNLEYYFCIENGTIVLRPNVSTASIFDLEFLPTSGETQSMDSEEGFFISFTDEEGEKCRLHINPKTLPNQNPVVAHPINARPGRYRPLKGKRESC